MNYNFLDSMLRFKHQYHLDEGIGFRLFIRNFPAYFLSILTFPLFRTKISSTVYAFSNGFFLFLISGWLVSNLVNILYRGDIFSFYLETKGLTLQTIDFSLVSLLTPLSFFFILLVATIGLATNIYTLNYFKNEADELSFL